MAKFYFYASTAGIFHNKLIFFLFYIFLYIIFVLHACLVSIVFFNAISVFAHLFYPYYIFSKLYYEIKQLSLNIK